MTELAKVLRTWEHITSHDKGKLGEEMRELILQTVRLLWELRDTHRTKTIDKLKLILEGQAEDPENWVKVAPVIEFDDTLNNWQLMLRDLQVGFAFNATGEQFLGVFNWKD